MLLGEDGSADVQDVRASEGPPAMTAPPTTSAVRFVGVPGGEMENVFPSPDVGSASTAAWMNETALTSCERDNKGDVGCRSPHERSGVYGFEHGTEGGWGKSLQGSAEGVHDHPLRARTAATQIPEIKASDWINKRSR